MKIELGLDAHEQRLVGLEQPDPDDVARLLRPPLASSTAMSEMHRPASGHCARDGGRLREFVMLQLPLDARVRRGSPGRSSPFSTRGVEALAARRERV